MSRLSLDYGEGVAQVRMSGIKTGWEQDFLLIADLHWDSPHCQRKMLLDHLKQARERDAGIIIVGDVFCAMQGKYDPRSDKSDVRPEHQVTNYLDALVDTAADYFLPFRDNIVLISPGNHEYQIEKRQETSLISRLTKQMDIPEREGGYGGFVRFGFKRSTNSGYTSRTLYYHHGHGGGGEVTKGVIQTARRAAYLGDVDICLSGHIHEAWLLVLPKLRVTEGGRWETYNQYHICTPTYKDEFTLEPGYHMEKGRAPKPLGGWWLRFQYNDRVPGRIEISPRLAQ